MESDHHHQRMNLFKSPWLDSCFYATLLPDSPWQKVLQKIGTALAEKVTPALQDAKKRQMIFKLLGRDFVETYFSAYPNVPSMLCTPNISDLEHENLEKQTRIWILDLCAKAAEQTGCSLSDGVSEPSEEMARFINHTYSLVEREMELHLAKHDAKEKESSLNLDPIMLRSFAKRPKSLESREVHFTLACPTAKPFKPDKVSPELKNSTVSSSGSEVLSDAVCDMIILDSENMSVVCEKLCGRLLPKTLRHFIWMYKLLKSDKNYKEENIKIIEKVMREKYGRALEHKLAKMKLRSATRSPISGLIENAVVEKYENTPCMSNFARDEYMVLESSKTLNVLYVYNGTYEPYLIHWLFPLQMGFKQTPKRAEHSYELFMYLHLLMKNIFPSWLEIFGMAERVINTLKTEDVNLFNHLQHSVQKNVNFNPKDFLVELICQEREAALKLYADESDLDHPTLQSELLASPVIFLRKWIGEGFVNSLDLPAVLLIWDQMFMCDWNRKVMEDFCLALIMLLKDSIMSAEDYPTVRQVFLYEAFHLFTSDIQRAWIHLQQGGLPADIPEMNQLKKRQLHDQSRILRAEKDPGLSIVISPLVVKDIILNLVRPLQEGNASSSQTHLKPFDPTAVEMIVSLVHGDKILSSKTSSLKPNLKDNLKPNNENDATSFTILFDDVYEFDLMDLSYKMNEGESGAEPFILLKAVYNGGKKDELSLGWATVEIFKQETSGTRRVWRPWETSIFQSLHPGKHPDTNESTPGSKMSSVEMKVYDQSKGHQLRKNEHVQTERNEKELLPVLSWVPHDDSTLLPPPTSSQRAFDLYIDAVHYIPDKATFIRVTGQILDSGKKIPTIVTFPVMNSSARNPEFKFYQALNAENERLKVTTSILFQVSTIDCDSENIAIIGNSILPVFNNEGQLNVGGFQKKLRTGLPSKPLDTLVPSDLNQYTIFPCCSLLVRLLPHSQQPEPMPIYSSGYYFSEEANPTRFEQEIMSTFQKDVCFPKLVKDMAGHLMEKEQSQVTEIQVEDWIRTRLDREKSLLQPSVKYINVHQATRYRQEIGIRLKIKQAFGLPDKGFYSNAFARILKGSRSINLPELPHHWGGDEKFLTQKPDFASLQRSPRWTDPSVVLHPYLDQQSVLLVQIFGMCATYIPGTNQDQRGHVISSNEQDLQLEPLLGWTVFPLFERNFANSGIHSAPLFQGLPSAEFLSALSSYPLKMAIKNCLKKNIIALLKTYGSVTVQIWDGHYLDDEHYTLPILKDLLTTDNIKKFLSTQTSKRGKELSALVIQSLGKSQQKLRTNSPMYQQHQQFFEQAMAEKFYDLIETALLNAGYGPL